MLIKLNLFVLLIFIGGFTYATNKKDAFKKAVDYSNCRIAYTYCKQYSIMKPESAEKKSYDQIDNIFKCSITESMAYDSINNILKRNNFSAFSKKSSVVISRILKEDVEFLSLEEAVAKIISGIFESVEFKDFFLQYPEVHLLKLPLTKEITDYLSKAFETNPNKINNDPNFNTTLKERDLEKQDSKLKKIITENNTSPFAINWLSIILMAVLSAAVYLVLKLKLTQIEERTNRHRQEIDSLEINREGNQKNSHSSQLNNSALKRFVEDKISEQNDSISKLQRDIDMFSSKTNIIFDPEKINQARTVQIENQQKSEVFYASIPERDGSFDENAITKTLNPTVSYYKFTIGKDSNVASFEFINDERAVKDAVSSPDLILYPVCKIKNSQNQNTKRIKTSSPGAVIKGNGKWELSTKAEIEYE